MENTVRLVSLSDGPDIVLDKPIILFGRHPECDVLLNSKKISRKHCCIALAGNSLIIRDLGSTNGVKINGKKMDEGQVQIGDELTIGVFPYKVTLGSLDLLRSGSPDENTLNEESGSIEP